MSGAKKWKYPATRRDINKLPVAGAIAPETCQNLLEDIIYLERADMKQIRRCLNNMFTDELEALTERFRILRAAIHEIKYERSPKGIARKEARKILIS